MSKSQENSRKHKQNSESEWKKSFYELVYLSNSRIYPKQQLDSLLFLLNLAQILIVFLNFDLVAIIQPKFLVFDINITIGLLSLLGVITLQIFIGLVYHCQFYLSLQFKIYRYVLYPSIIRYFCNQLLTKEILPEPASILIIITLFSLTWVLSLPFSQQSFAESSILPRNIPINSFFLPFQTLLFVSQHTEQSLLKKAFIAILFFYTLIIKFAILKEYPKTTIQERMVRIISSFFLFFASILFYSTLIPNGLTDNFVFCLVPLAFMVFAKNFLRKKLIPSETINVFETDVLKGQQFIERIQYIIEQMRFVSQAQVPQFVDSFIVAFCEQIQKQNNPNCQLLFEIKKGLFKGFGQQKTMKQGLNKVARKIQSLFQEVVKNEPQNQRLKISMLKFYMICLPNKNRMIQLLAQVNRKQLNFFQEIDIRCIEKQVTLIGVSETVESLTLDECITQFHIKMLIVLNFISEFWTELLEQSVDLNKLIAISQKLYPLKRDMEHECNRITNFQNYNSVIILKTYAQYARIILNEEKNSIIIQDYAVALNRKLLQMRQIKTLSSDSQTATIALSLSEGSLGVIKMANPQAAFIFGYLKSEISKLRVNDIMPSTIARHHDDILLAYLAHRNKMINTDQRQMIGKSKNGYVFPIILQLQSAIASVNQQLIFVANIKKTKVKASPILCLVNQQGVIQQVSSMFKKLFLFKKKFKDLNIQEIIPDFFSNNFKSGEIETFNLTAKVQTQSGISDVFFKASQINLPCRNNVGYIIRGNFKHQNFKTKMSITDKLLQNKEQGKLNGNVAQYCSLKNEFLIETKAKNLSQISKHQQFTIPFLTISDMANILAVDNKVNKYDNDIKAVRLNRDHLERVEDISSFQSQQYSEFDTKEGLKKKLSEIKEGAMASEQKNFSFRVKLFVLIISLIVAAYLGTVIVQIDAHSANHLKLLHIEENKLLSRGLIAELVAYFTAIDSSIDTIRYQSKKVILKKQLIEVLNEAYITQKQKQEALKVIYLEKASDLPIALSNQNLHFDLIPNIQVVSLQIFWSVLLVAIVFLAIVLIVSFCFLSKKIEDTYSMFLALDQKTIRQILQGCILFSRKIQRQTNGGQQNSKIVRYDDQQEESPVQKFKKFKNRTNSKTRLYLIKLLAPIVVYLCFVTGIMIYADSVQSRVTTDHQLHFYSSSLNAQCSVATMKTLLKTVKGIGLQLDSSFEQRYQNIQNNIEKTLKQSYENKAEFYEYLLSNPCHIQGLPSNCQTFLNGIMKGGLSKGINYLAIGLRGLQEKIVAISSIGQLMYLQFEIIRPVLNHLTESILQNIQKDTDSQRSLLQTLTLVMIGLVLIGCFYLCKYPVEQFNDQLTSIAQLIKLIPTNYRKPENNGYVKLDW